MEERPRTLTDEQVLRVARDTAEELHALDKEFDIDATARDLAAYGGWHMDGFELAKTMEDYCRWTCDFSICEILDGYSYGLDQAIREAQEEWAARCNPKPPLPVGSRIITNHGDTGTIAEIYDRGPAQYLVDLDREPPYGGKLIVNFEDALAA